MRDDLGNVLDRFFVLKAASMGLIQMPDLFEAEIASELYELTEWLSRFGRGEIQ